MSGLALGKELGYIPPRQLCTTFISDEQSQERELEERFDDAEGEDIKMNTFVHYY